MLYCTIRSIKFNSIIRGLNKILLYKKVDLFKPNSVIMCLIQRELKPYSEKKKYNKGSGTSTNFKF